MSHASVGPYGLCTPLLAVAYHNIRLVLHRSVSGVLQQRPQSSDTSPKHPDVRSSAPPLCTKTLALTSQLMGLAFDDDVSHRSVSRSCPATIIRGLKISAIEDWRRNLRNRWHKIFSPSCVYGSAEQHPLNATQTNRFYSRRAS